MLQSSEPTIIKSFSKQPSFLSSLASSVASASSAGITAAPANTATSKSTTTTSSETSDSSDNQQPTHSIIPLLKPSMASPFLPFPSSSQPSSSNSLKLSNGSLTELGGSFLNLSQSSTPSSSSGKLYSIANAPAGISASAKKTPTSSSSASLLKAHSRGSFSRLLLESGKCNGPADVLSSSHSLLYRLIQLLVFLIRLITPLSYAYFAFHFVRPKAQIIAALPGGVLTYTIFTLWMLAEALFFPYYYYLFRRLNSTLNHELKHLCTDKQSRLRLVQMCFDAMSLSGPPQDPAEVHIRKVLEGWFLDEPLMKIHFGNMSAWTAWAFFGKDVKMMSEDEVHENHEIVCFIEKAAKWTFPPGFNADIPPLRLNLDPMFATQRPFFFYACIYIVTVLTHFFLQTILGFSLVSQFSTKAQKIYYRKARRANGSNGLPIVFIHGIGIGFTHYLPIILQLPDDVDVFLVEWPYVAMQMTTTAPTAEESVQSMVEVLDHFQHEKATFLAHSLGTVMIAWMFHDPRCAAKVASTVILDPIIFLLCDPKVASVFVYKDPANSWDLLMHFFLSRELFISNALSRHFAWSYNILFVEEMLNNKRCCTEFQHLVLPISVPSNNIDTSDQHVLQITSSNGHSADGTNEFSEEQWKKHHVKHREIEHTIVLATNDMIVPTACVSRYLTAKKKQGFLNFELIVLEGTHGEVTFIPKWIRFIKKKLFDRSHMNLSVSASSAEQLQVEAVTSSDNRAK